MYKQSSITRQQSRRLNIIFMLAMFISLQKHSTVDGAYAVAKDKERCKLVGYQLKLSFPTCYDSMVNLNTCLGACISATGPFTRNKMTEMTTCCRVVKYQEVHVRIKCKYQPNYFHTVRSATECSCGKCPGS